MISYVRQAITTNGGTPHSFRLIDAWRELVTAYGGTPTSYRLTDLIRQAITAVGGTPTQRAEIPLLRELLTALGVSPVGYVPRTLYQALAITASGPSIVYTPALSPVPEGTAAGTLIGELSMLNPEAGTYTFTEETDASGKFSNNGTNGKDVRTAGTWDYDTATSYSVTYKADNGAGSVVYKTITVPVSNVLEVTLAAITGTFSLAENAALNAVAGAYSGKTSGSTLSLSDDAGGRVAISGGNIVRGATALDYETATSHSFTFYETHPDAAPRSTTVSLTVTDIDEAAPTLSSPADAANGATGATISVSTNEGNGTLYWFVSTSATPPSASALKAGTGAAAAGSQAVSGTGAQNASPTGLTELTAYYTYFLHRDAAGNDSTIAAADGFTTEAAPSYPSLANMPAITDALNTTGRAFLGLIGDSTTVGYGAGATGVLDNAANRNKTKYLADDLTALGFNVSFDSFGFGDKGTNTPDAAGVTAYYGSNCNVHSTWTMYGGVNTPWGGGALGKSTDANPIICTPRQAADTIRLFYLQYPGNGTISVDRGGSAQTVDSNGTHTVGYAELTFARGTQDFNIKVTAGFAIVFGAVLYDSTTARLIVLHQLGNGGWTTANWLTANSGVGSGNALQKLKLDGAIINLGINNKYQGLVGATFQSELETIANLILTADAPSTTLAPDVVLEIPNSCTSGNAGDFNSTWKGYVTSAATNKSLRAPLNLYAVHDPHASYTARFTDDIHPNNLGYGDLAAAEAAYL